MEFFILIFFFVSAIFIFYFIIKVITSIMISSKNQLNNQNFENKPFFFNEDLNNGIYQLLKDLKLDNPSQNPQNQVSNAVHTINPHTKNIDAEALERTKLKEEAIKNKKIKNIDAEALERWKKKKEQLNNHTHRNIEKEALENAKVKKDRKKIKIQQIKPLEKLVKKNQKTSSIQMLYPSKSDLKKAFLLQEILNKPEF